MKREIKFRAKVLAKYAPEQPWVDGYFTSSYAKSKKCYAIENDNGHYIVDPDTVRQYTGYKDAEGNEVYEGDILDTKETQFSASDKVFRFVCEWYLSGMALRFIGRKYGCSESNRWMNRWPVGAENVADLVVVGNIYDNPELLKSDERPTETAE